MVRLTDIRIEELDQILDRYISGNLRLVKSVVNKMWMDTLKNKINEKVD